MGPREPAVNPAHRPQPCRLTRPSAGVWGGFPSLRHTGHCASAPGDGHREGKAAGQTRAPRWFGGTSSLIQSVTLGKTVDARQTSRQDDAGSNQLHHFASRVPCITGIGDGQTSGPAQNLTPVPPRGTARLSPRVLNSTGPARWGPPLGATQPRERQHLFPALTNPNPSSCFLWHSRSRTLGLHNRNSMGVDGPAGAVSTRASAPPCDLSFPHTVISRGWA